MRKFVFVDNDFSFFQKGAYELSLNYNNNTQFISDGQHLLFGRQIGGVVWTNLTKKGVLHFNNLLQGALLAMFYCKLVYLKKRCLLANQHTLKIIKKFCSRN